MLFNLIVVSYNFKFINKFWIDKIIIIFFICYEKIIGICRLYLYDVLVKD